ncbi:uncharacterized protein LOC143374990 isoform X2 [Andrena cerasifolii]|uniref:uncharacterized protein LOC143374990 isoform X2 n=1 Tax=Andrena cerasifolii TaxID=2819439 RepID=UPI004037DC49
MGSTVKDLKAYDVEQMAIIGKMHGMQWLKSNSLSSGHTKKTHPDVKEVIIDCSLKSQINEGTAESTKVASTSSISNSPQLRDNDPDANKDIDNGGSITKPIHSGLTIVDSSRKGMETVWNKDVNVTSALFPNSQSLVVQRLDEQTSASMNLAENIVTAQLEQFRINEGGKDKIDESHNEGVDEWSTIHNAPGSPKSDTDVGDQLSSKQCHDNNNNNAKSKAQPTSELKRRSSLKEPCTILKQGSKDKDELSDSSIIDNKTSTPAADSKRISVGITPKVSDKCGKFNGHNRQLITGRGLQTKEQQIFKQHFSMLNDSGNRNKLSAEGLDDKSKSSATKLRSSRCESDKKSNEIGETKCHKVQVTRTQSYNVQYNPSKALIKPQQRYLRNTTRVEEENSVKHTSGFNNNINVSNSADTVSKKKCENQQTAMNKQISDTRFSQSGSGIGSKDFNVPECGTNERNLMKTSNSMQCKKSYQNLSSGKTNADKNVKDDQGCAQKFKKNFSTYRSSTGAPQTFSKDLHGKVRTEDHKKTIADNNPVKEFKVTRPCSVDAKARAPPEDSRITVYPHKTVNGASNTNKTDTSGSSSVNNVQSAKSLNSCSHSTKDSTAVDTSTRTSQEPEILEAACNGTEVQLVKTEQEDTCNNNSNNKAASINTETRSVTFSENVQEVNMVDHSAMSYIDNSVQQAKLTSDQFYSDLQGASHIANAQQIESHQGVQNKSYFNQTNAQYSNMSANIPNPERDLYLLDVAQQKPEQASHVSPQSVQPHSNCNPAISMGNGVPYQNMSAVYLNQYTNAQTVPRKTADTTIVSHSPMVPNTSSYTMESQNMMQSEPASILMHNTQTSVLPPPGFHNHPVSSQHNQWNLPLPDMYLYGNLMNPTSPLNMQIPNSRQLCNADYSNIQQTGYLQHPLFYVPQMCMQSWNPLLQYPAALFQNPPYSNCGTYPNQVLPQNSLADTMNCTVPASVQSNPFKQFLQLQQLESSQGFSVPSAKLESYPGNVHGGKASSARMKGSCMNARSSQYRGPMSSEYQNYSHDAQLTSPYSYAAAMDSIARNSPSSVHMQASQKYPSRALTAANYQRMPDACSAYQSHQDSGRKDDVPKVDSECMPPMVSPRDCMYYGVNYSRNTDTVQSLPLRAAAKPVAYTHPVNSQHYNPHYQRHATYQTTPKELTSRAPIGRGIRKSTEQ